MCMCVSICVWVLEDINNRCFGQNMEIAGVDNLVDNLVISTIIGHITLRYLLVIEYIKLIITI